MLIADKLPTGGRRRWST